MAVIGFKEYKDGDRYKARRVMGRTSNLIWKIVGGIVMILALGWAIQTFGPCRSQVMTTINDAPPYLH